MVLTEAYQPPLFPTEKACSACGRLLPLDGFYRKRGTPDGLTSACKACVKERVRAYQEQHRDERRAYGAAHYAANRERLAAEARARYQENRPACLEQKRKAYEPERERRKALRLAREQAAAAAQEKRCSRCCRLLPLDAFYAKKSGRHGVGAHCKECIRTHMHDYHEHNRAARNARSAGLL